MSAVVNAGVVEALLRLRDELTPVMARVSAGLMSTGATATKVGVGLSTGLSLPLAGIGIAALKMSTDFNKGMANISALIPGNTARILELKSAVQATAVSMGKGTGDMADGLYDLISTLGDSADSVKLLEINAKAAAAGLATTQQAIGLTTAITKTYGDTSAAATQRVADMAFQAVNIGKTTFPELAASIGAVTPLAQSAGVKLEELFGVLATATGVTGNTSEVVSQMRASLTALMNPTQDMTQLLASLGKTGAQAGADLIAERGFVGALAAVREKAAALDLPLGKVLGRVEAQVITLSLAGSQAQNYAKNLDLMGRAAGSTDTAFAAQTQGINKAGFAWEQFKVKVEVATQKLGDHLLPVVLRVGESLAPLFDRALSLVDAFGKLPQPVQTAAIAFGGLLIALGPLLMGAGSLMMLAGALSPLVAPGTGALALFATGVKSAGAAAASSGILVAGFSAALAGIVVPFALSKVVEMIEQIRGLMKDSAGWRKDAEGVADTFRNQIASASQIAGKEVKTVSEAFKVQQQRIAELRMNWGPLNGEMKISAETASRLALAVGGTATAVKGVIDPLAGLREEAKRLQKDALTPLSAGQREIALAFAKAGVEVGEIAEKLHVTKGAVMAVLDAQKKATDTAAAYNESLKQQVAHLQGLDVLAKAKELLAAYQISQSHGIDLGRMTRDVQLEMADTMSAAVAVYVAAGKQVPSAFAAIANEARLLSSALKLLPLDVLPGINVGRPTIPIPPLKINPLTHLPGTAVGPPEIPKMSNWTQMFGSSKEFGASLGATIMGALQGGGNPITAAAGSVGTSITSHIAKELTTKGGMYLSGALGGALNAVLPGLGALMGPLLGKLGGLLKGAFGFGTAGRDLVKEFAASFDTAAAGDGFQELQKKLEVLGPKADVLWRALTQGVGKNNPAQAKTAIDNINLALAEHERRTAAVQAAEERKAAAVTEAMARQQAAMDAITAKYGEGIKKLQDELASFADALAAEEAAPEFNEFGERIYGVVETQQRARKQQIENEMEALKVARDAELAEAAKTGESTIQALKDATLESFGLMTDAVNNLANAIRGIPNGSFKVTGQYEPGGYGGPSSEGLPEPGFAGGTHGRYLDFGMGTAVTLHGRERVMTEAEGQAQAAAPHQTIIFKVGDQVVARSAVRGLPAQLTLEGR